MKTKLEIFIACIEDAAVNVNQKPAEKEQAPRRLFSTLGLETKQDWNAFSGIYAEARDRVQDYALQKMPSELAAEKLI